MRISDRVVIRPAGLRDACFVAANMRAQDRAEIYAVSDAREGAQVAAILLMASPGLAFTAWLDGEPVAVFGVALVPGASHLSSGWAYGTSRMARAVPAMTRHIVNVLAPAVMALGVTRCEVRTMVGHDLSHGWLRSMGAVGEGISRRYGRNGEDFAVYAWTKD